jgi:phospholipase/carboxylesterase
MRFTEREDMPDNLNELVIEPVSGLAHRVRMATGDQQPAPCLLLLHGVGSNELGFVELARQLDPRLVVIVLRGPLTFAPMQFGWFRVGFTASGPAIDAAQAEQSRLKLLDFIGQLPKLYNVDPARVWIAGFSQGGIMSASVGLTAPQGVAGFGLMSGRILPEILPIVRRGPELGKVQAFVSHGTEDQTLGVHFARSSRELLTELGVPLEYREYETGHALNSAMVGDFEGWIVKQL